MRILTIGDIVGEPAVGYIGERLWKKREEYKVDMVIANAENVMLRGLEPRHAEELFSRGVDVITGGNHSFDRRALFAMLENEEYLLRPANYPAGVVGHGYTVWRSDAGVRVFVLNVQGVALMEPLDCPFATTERILSREEGSYDVSIVDMHAEATSEKLAYARYFDGKFAAVFGTHTHVATADEQILPHGCGFISDIGMSGPHGGVIGVRTDIVIDRFIHKMPGKHELAEGAVAVHGAVFDIDEDKNITKRVERIVF